MKTFFILLSAIFSCFLAADACAKITITPPPEVPPNLTSRDFRELTAQRNAMLDQYYAAQEKIDRQAGNCRRVEEGSPKVNECIAEAQEVKSEARKYREAVKGFSSMIAEALAWQRARDDIFNKKPVYAKPDSIAAKPPEDVQHLVTADGMKLDGKDVKLTSENGKESIVTGPDGYALFKFPDGTVIKLGSDTTFVPKTHEPTPEPDKNPAMELVKGKLRWLHDSSSELIKRLKETPVETRSRLIYEGKIKVARVRVAVLGTEFECVALPDGSGNIKLYSGEVSVTSKTGEVVTLKPGQMVSFTKDKLAPVAPIPESVR